MAEIVATGQVASLRDILRDLGSRLAEQGAMALLEREPDGWVDERAARQALIFGLWDPSLDPDTYDRGYVFTETFQVAWRRGEAGTAGFAVSYTGVGPAPGVLGAGQEVQAKPEERRYMLWGTREASAGQQATSHGTPAALGPDTAAAIPDPRAAGAVTGGEFKESRLPNPACPLHYPVAGSVKEACLVVRELTDPATGEVVAFRYIGVAGAEDAT